MSHFQQFKVTNHNIQHTHQQRRKNKRQHKKKHKRSQQYLIARLLLLLLSLFSVPSSHILSSWISVSSKGKLETRNTHSYFCFVLVHRFLGSFPSVFSDLVASSFLCQTTTTNKTKACCRHGAAFQCVAAFACFSDCVRCRALLLVVIVDGGGRSNNTQIRCRRR